MRRCHRFIERLRAKSRGDGEPSLTPRRAHALAGAWYSWFIAEYGEDPGTADEWELVADEYEEVCLKFRPSDEHSDLLQNDEPRTLAERNAIHRVLTGQAEEMLIGSFMKRIEMAW